MAGDTGAKLVDTAAAVVDDDDNDGAIGDVVVVVELSQSVSQDKP